MKKKLSIFLICLCLLMTFGFKTETDTDSSGCTNCNEVAQSLADMGEYYDVEWHEEHFNTRTPKRASAYLNITNYYQTDYSDIMKTCNKTIANSGCALTSVTMVSNYLTNKNRNPSQVNAILGNYACPLYWYEAASRLGMSVVRYGSASYPSISSTMISYLNSGNPVIIEMELSSGIDHYVVVKGYNNNGSSTIFYINDPSRNINHTTLKQYLDDDAVVTGIIVYD